MQKNVLKNTQNKKRTLPILIAAKSENLFFSVHGVVEVVGVVITVGVIKIIRVVVSAGIVEVAGIHHVADFVKIVLHKAIINNGKPKYAEQKINQRPVFMRNTHILAAFCELFLGKIEAEERQENHKHYFQHAVIVSVFYADGFTSELNSPKDGVYAAGHNREYDTSGYASFFNIHIVHLQAQYIITWFDLSTFAGLKQS